MHSARLTLLVVSSLALPLVIDPTTDATQATTSGVVTLYAQDDLLSSFDFRSGGPGARVADGEVRLESAQILFDVLEAGRISYGFTRDERVEIIDLGDVTVAPEERSRDRALEFPISIFHTLGQADEGFFVVRPGGDVDPFGAADRIRGAMPLPAVRHIEPRIGHVYLLRIRTERSTVDEIFKFQVIDLIPEHSLTLRWGRVAGI